MIRQAISCDVCGAEKKQTNHWFVACNQGDELRVCAFNARTRLKPGSKHLCGQACLHKLVDEFISNALGGRIATSGMEGEESTEQRVISDASLTSKAAYRDSMSPQKSLPAAAFTVAPRIPAVPAAVVAMQPRPLVEQSRPAGVSSNMAEAASYTSRHWRAEAWEREREREMRASPTPRRKSS